jgi:hypothetical protein
MADSLELIAATLGASERRESVNVPGVWIFKVPTPRGVRVVRWLPEALIDQPIMAIRTVAEAVARVIGEPGLVGVRVKTTPLEKPNVITWNRVPPHDIDLEW